MLVSEIQEKGRGNNKRTKTDSWPEYLHTSWCISTHCRGKAKDHAFADFSSQEERLQNEGKEICWLEKAVGVYQKRGGSITNSMPEFNFYNSSNWSTWRKRHGSDRLTRSIFCMPAWKMRHYNDDGRLLCRVDGNGWIKDIPKNLLSTEREREIYMLDGKMLYMDYWWVQCCSTRSY